MKLIPLPASGKIAKPGVYGLSMDEYHSDICVGPSISSSGLRTIESRTPAHFWATSCLNPDAEPQEDSEAFALGRAAHALLLEGGLADNFVVRPDRWADWRTSAAKDWRDEQIAAGKTVLLPSDLDAITGIAKSLAGHALIKAGILQGQVESSLIWQDGPTGVWLKSRPDVLPVADGVVVDLKSTTDASLEAVQRTIRTYGYAMQGALVGQGLEKVLGIKMSAFALVFVEKTSPYAVNVVEIDPDWLWYAGRQLRRAIDTFARCIESGDWPGFEGERVVYMPDWFRKRLESEAELGQLPEHAA